MRQKHSHTIAVAGVVVAAILSSLLIQPAVGQLATWDTTWLAAVIFGAPTVLVLALTGYRHYGVARSIAVAIAVMAITAIVSWVASIYAVASAISASETSLALTVALYAIPAVSVLALGLLALKFVPAAPTTGRAVSARGHRVTRPA